jgi:hypothetical protein
MPLASLEKNSGITRDGVWRGIGAGACGGRAWAASFSLAAWRCARIGALRTAPLLAAALLRGRPRR